MTRRSLFAATMAAALPRLAEAAKPSILWIDDDIVFPDITPDLIEAKPMPSFRVSIETIQHRHQRYPTAGDYQSVPEAYGGRLTILVSEMPDWRYMALVAVHELVEAILCKERGIAEEDVTAWDKQFEEDRAHDRRVMVERLDELKSRRGEGPRDEHEESDLEADIAEMPAEPGDHPGAPYHDEHMFATRVEEMLAKQLGVSWDEYTKAIEVL